MRSQKEVSVLSGPILQGLAHKVHFVSDHHSLYQAQIVQQSASCLNLWPKGIFLYHMIGVKCNNVINHVLSVLMDDLLHFCTFSSVCLLLLCNQLFEQHCLNSIFLSSNCSFNVAEQLATNGLFCCVVYVLCVLCTWSQCCYWQLCCYTGTVIHES